MKKNPDSKKTKSDILQARENSTRDEIILEQLRAEMRILNEKLLSTKAVLEQQNTKFIVFVDELTQLERKMDYHENESGCLKQQIVQMRRILEGVEEDAEDAKQELLDKTFQENFATSNGLTLFTTTLADPFTSDDPFASNNSGTNEGKIQTKETDNNNFANFTKFTNS
jgi:chromosome segregation ATPase